MDSNHGPTDYEAAERSVKLLSKLKNSNEFLFSHLLSSTETEPLPSPTGFGPPTEPTKLKIPKGFLEPNTEPGPKSNRGPPKVLES